MGEQEKVVREISLDQLINESEAERAAQEAPQSESGGLPPPPPEEGFEILKPDSTPVKLSTGEEVVLRPMVIDQIAEFMKVTKKLMPQLIADAKGGEGFNVTQLIAIDKKNTYKAIAITLERPVDVDDEDEADILYYKNVKARVKWLKQLNGDDFILVVAKSLVVNLDFFIRALPVAFGIAEKSVESALQSLLGKGGLSRFSDLFQMGTPSSK